MEFLARFGRNLIIWTVVFGGTWLLASLLIFVEPFRNWVPEGLRVWLFLFWIGFPMLPLYILFHAFLETAFENNDKCDHPGGPSDGNATSDRAQSGLRKRLIEMGVRSKNDPTDNGSADHD